MDFWLRHMKYVKVCVCVCPHHEPEKLYDSVKRHRIDSDLHKVKVLWERFHE